MLPRACLAICIVAATVSLHAASVFVADVDRIADAIEANYFDAARARSIAAELRATARSRELDSVTDPRILASALTSRLQPHDGHFVVTWTAAEAEDASGEHLPPDGAADADRRGAYGFRRVEMLPGAVGYVDLRWFAHFEFDDGRANARRAADAALALIGTADAVIIDLRDNGGGSPSMVGYLVSAFTAPNADIYNVFHSRVGTESERPKTPYPHPRLDVPLYVLVSGRTGSAAEAAAYTLQAAKRAVIVGERSAGAANPGEFVPVGNGFAVFVSTGTPINAVTGRNWEDSGVVPDVLVASHAAVERAHVMALETITARQADTVDARWTLEAMRAMHTNVEGAPFSEYAGRYGDAVVGIGEIGLSLQRGTRPPWTLVRLAGDTFFARDEPTRRVVFQRSAGGDITALEIASATGQSTLLRREASPGSPPSRHP